MGAAILEVGSSGSASRAVPVSFRGRGIWEQFRQGRDGRPLRVVGRPRGSKGGPIGTDRGGNTRQSRASTEGAICDFKMDTVCGRAAGGVRAAVSRVSRMTL